MKTLILLLFIGLVNPVHAFPLQNIEAQLIHLKQEGKRPVAIFDLDETLIDSGKRRIASYLKAIQLNRAQLIQNYPVETPLAENKLAQSGERILFSLSNQYDSNALFLKMGVTHTPFIQELSKLMLPIYLSSDFISEDTAYRGASYFLEMIYRAHGIVHFVSSRYQVAQGSETLKNLIKNRLYKNKSQSHLFLRNDHEASLDFKVRAFKEIRESLNENQSVVFVGENEPENLNAMIDLFPEAQPIFVAGAILNTGVTLKNPSNLIITQDYAEDEDSDEE